MDFGIDIETLLKTPQEQLTQEQINAIHWYNVFNPVDMGMCTINKICFYIENKIGEYKSKLRERKFDWGRFKVKRRCTQEHKDKLQELMQMYINRLTLISDTEMELSANKVCIDEYIQMRAKEICPNDDERRNIVLDLCYGDNSNKSNKEFCWTIIADMILRERYTNE
jgi:hypothetical protein